MSKPYFRQILLVFGLITLSACSELPYQSFATKGKEVLFLNVPCQADNLLLYYQELRKQSSADLAKEYEKSKLSLAQTRNESNRVRMALLMLLPNTPYYDVSAALALVNEPATDPKSNVSGLGGLTNLLNMFLSEQRGVTEDLLMRLKAEHKRAEALQDKVEVLQRRAEEFQVKMEVVQRRAEELQAKVDAIKDMEKNIIRREQH